MDGPFYTIERYKGPLESYPSSEFLNLMRSCSGSASEFHRTRHKSIPNTSTANTHNNLSQPNGNSSSSPNGRSTQNYEITLPGELYANTNGRNGHLTGDSSNYGMRPSQDPSDTDGHPPPTSGNGWGTGDQSESHSSPKREAPL